MERYNNSLIREQRILENRIANRPDENEPARELEELQRSLAERISTMERVAQRNQAAGTG